MKRYYSVYIADSFVVCTTYSSLFSLWFTSVSGGRLECTMQNIADNYSNSYSSRCYNDVEGMPYIIHVFVWSDKPYVPFAIELSLTKTLHIMWADKLDTFIVYNERRRVTSSAKKKRRHGDKSLHQVWFTACVKYEFYV